MQRKSGIGQGIDQPVFQHEAGTVVPLFPWLEHEGDGALQFGLPRRQHPRRAGQHRRVGIVAAGMHRPLDLRRKRQSGLFRHRQGIHIAAQQNMAPGCRTLQRRHQAGGRGPLAPGQRQVGKGSAHLVAGARGVEAQLGLGMDGTAQRDDLIRDRAGGF